MSSEPDSCSYCGPFGFDAATHWLWQKDSRYSAGGRWKCREKKRMSDRRYTERKRNDPVRAAAQKDYDRAYAKNNAHWLRVKAYRHHDKRLGRESITWAKAKPLLDADCHYCGLAPAGGLDRIDNELGHEPTNVRPCCRTCNFILSDLPVAAKDALAAGLRDAREKGHLTQWVPPNMRSRAA